MAYKCSYNGYTFPATIRPSSPGADVELGEQERPRASGSIVQSGRKKSRIVPLDGGIVGSSADALQTVIDALRAACVGVGVQRLFAGRDDRFWLAQLQSLKVDEKQGKTYGLLWNVSLEFLAGDPDAYGCNSETSEAIVTTVTGLIGGGAVTAAGNAFTLPVWTVTFGTGGFGPGSFTIANSTTGETATVTGTFSSGDVVVLDRSKFAVTVNGVASTSVFDGQMPGLVAGANTIVVTGVSSPHALQVAYAPRYA